MKISRLFSMATALVAASAATLAFGSPSMDGQPSQDSGRYIVKVKDHSESRALQLSSLVTSLGGRTVHALPSIRSIAVELSPEKLAELSRDPRVASIQNDARRSFLGTAGSGPYKAAGQTIPYGIPMVQADRVSDAKASNMTVCVIDTGYDGAQVDLPHGTNVTGEGGSNEVGDWQHDGVAHGTHVAGTILALNNKKGVVGVLPNNQVKLHFVKAFDDRGMWASDLIKNTEMCANAGANIISMSLGGPGPVPGEGEQFQSLADRGILSIAAAGNSGGDDFSYPASYAAVVSVAAVDKDAVVASFSTHNSEVEISGPGVAVLSTVPMHGLNLHGVLTTDTESFDLSFLRDSPQLTARGQLVYGGTGRQPEPNWDGAICLIRRGDISIQLKAINCQNGGGKAVIVYNDVPGDFEASLTEPKLVEIPVFLASDTEGAALMAHLYEKVKLKYDGDSYAEFSGTSMATPHVAGVAALVWSRHPECTASEIRSTLNLSAKDLGEPGRDVYYGYGLVQAKDALDRIRSKGCGK